MCQNHGSVIAKAWYVRLFEYTLWSNCDHKTSFFTWRAVHHLKSLTWCLIWSLTPRYLILNNTVPEPRVGVGGRKNRKKGHWPKLTTAWIALQLVFLGSPYFECWGIAAVRKTVQLMLMYFASSFVAGSYQPVNNILDTCSCWVEYF